MDGLRSMLAVRPDGKWAAFEVAELCPRQNGKTAMFMARALAGLFLLDERVILWSAHEFKTSMRAFRDLRRLIRTLGEPVSDVLIEVDGIPVKVNNAAGSEGFERLDTGQELKMVARSKGSGRGFSTDCMIVDEAFAYEEIHQDALMPTLSARPNPQICYASSPPLNGRSGGPLYALRARAEAGGDETLAWRDWGAGDVLDDVLRLPPMERDAWLDDRARWASTNPAFGLGRVSEESILRLRRSLTPAGFGREILGLWPRQVLTETGWSVISEAAWRARGGLTFADRPDDELRLAVAAAWPDAESGAISLAGRRGGEVLVQVIEHRPGTGWIVDRVKELRGRHDFGPSVVLDRKGPARVLIPDFEDAGITLEHPATEDVAQAAAMFYDGVAGDGPELRHYDQPELETSLAAAQKRPVGDGWTWARKGVIDICPLEAATLATWAVKCRQSVEPWAVWA